MRDGSRRCSARHDVADRHLNTAFQIVDAFDWDYHRAAILMARAAARHGPFGQKDDTARSWLHTAADICVARGLPGIALERQGWGVVQPRAAVAAARAVT